MESLAESHQEPVGQMEPLEKEKIPQDSSSKVDETFSESTTALSATSFTTSQTPTTAQNQEATTTAPCATTEELQSTVSTLQDRIMVLVEEKLQLQTQVDSLQYELKQYKEASSQWFPLTPRKPVLQHMPNQSNERVVKESTTKSTWFSRVHATSSLRRHLPPVVGSSRHTTNQRKATPPRILLTKKRAILSGFSEEAHQTRN